MGSFHALQHTLTAHTYSTPYTIHLQHPLQQHTLTTHTYTTPYTIHLQHTLTPHTYNTPYNNIHLQHTLTAHPTPYTYNTHLQHTLTTHTYSTPYNIHLQHTPRQSKHLIPLTISSLFFSPLMVVSPAATCAPTASATMG